MTSVSLRAMFLGYGNVGKALRKMIKERGEKTGLNVKIEAVVNRSGIMLEDSDNFIKNKEGGPIDALNMTNPDVIIDVSSANYESGEPSLSLYREALSRGIHVVTANKAPLALRYGEIMDLAKKHSASVGFQATVMSGTPSINLLRLMRGLKIVKIRGILNGTTNYILTRMHQGLEYDQALKEAQALGYAETNPEHDVNGFDAAAKLTILTNFAMGLNLSIKDVVFSGIENIRKSSLKGKKVKLIAYSEGRFAKVSPEEITKEDPLYNVEGVMNALDIHSDIQEVVIMGPGAGPQNAAFGLFSDIVLITKGLI
ncbi:homoserine dehydrogenase [Metallosphaera cuprina]|uniref:Homoserine dehydrogenase n=1 Tax=Metallosphaera cuprina (strain Ar-4) TaxID=1006006 RepID=F4FZ83_METCR|nr:homoserine dehydrogenase [Metallosphaera cuprina]AEB94392.1 homoserine dehydrogenase [Metallosphaera cuprina Ar-4]